MTPTACLYTYLAVVTQVYDGDTITVDVDLGMRTWVHSEKVRLARIDAPEMRGEERPAGIISRDWLREQILGKRIILRTIKDRKGKYGRYLGEVYLDGVNINDQLLEQGLAEPWREKR